MVVSNRLLPHMARYGRNLPVATDMLCEGDSPYHMDVCEDGTFAGLEDDEVDATGNPRALIPCDVRPDSVVSQHAVVPYASRTIVPSQTGDNIDRPQGSTTNAVV